MNQKQKAAEIAKKATDAYAKWYVHSHITEGLESAFTELLQHVELREEEQPPCSSECRGTQHATAATDRVDVKLMYSSSIGYPSHRGAHVEVPRATDSRVSCTTAGCKVLMNPSELSKLYEELTRLTKACEQLQQWHKEDVAHVNKLESYMINIRKVATDAGYRVEDVMLAAILKAEYYKRKLAEREARARKTVMDNISRLPLLRGNVNEVIDQAYRNAAYDEIVKDQEQGR